VRSGTAARTLGDFPRPAAGKTGTTDKNVDAWFVGYTPQLTTAVWMGNPAGEISMNPYFGQEVFGGTIPARIWRAFMEPAHFALPVLDFTPPDPTFWPASRYISLTGRATQAPPTTTPTTIPAPTTTQKKSKPTTPTTKPKKQPKPPTPTTQAGGP